MNKLVLWSRARRTADRAVELASALDAGLPPQSALRSIGVAADVQHGIASALRRADFALTAAEFELLDACERAGRLPPALRRLAESRNAWRERQQVLAAALAYPALLWALALLLCFTLVPTGRTLGITLAGVVLATAGLIMWTLFRMRRAQDDPGVDPRRWPALGAALSDAAEIPYLEALAALHGAGVRIDEAHRIATRTVPLAATRARMVAATRGVESGRPLVEELASHGALGAESIELLAHAERNGTLEEALARAVARRREMCAIRSRRLARGLGSLAYLSAALVVLLVALNFYGGLFTNLQR